MYEQLLKNILIYIPSNDFDESAFSALKNSILREGINPFIVSEENSVATGSVRMKIQPDVNSFNVNAVNFSGLSIIGKESPENIAGSSVLKNIVTKFFREEKFIFTVKVGSVLLAKSFSANQKVASSPSCKPYFIKTDFTPVDSDIVRSGNFLSTRTVQAINDVIKLIFQKV